MADTVVIDFGMGNLRSVAKALEHVGARVAVSGDPAVIRAAERVVFPGQGAMGACVSRLAGHGLEDRADGKRAGVPWLGMPVAEIGALDRVLVVGSFLRKDHALIAQRLRQAAKRGQQINLLHVAGDDPLVRLANRLTVAPSALPVALARIARAVIEAKGGALPPALAQLEAAPAVTETARAIAASLASGARVGIFLGNAAEQHPRAAELHAIAQELAGALDARFGFLGEAANSVGGYLAGCVPGPGGMNAGAMLADPRKAYVLLNVEPALDCHNAAQALAAMHAADMVIALSAFGGGALDYADVILPIGPFTDTSGTFVNTEGRAQSFNGVVPPLGDARPAWKVLRVLGNMLGVEGFDFDTSEAVRDAACRASDVAGRLDNRVSGIAPERRAPAPALERVADVPIYSADPLVRRASSLQQTHDAAPPRAFMNAATIARLGLAAGAPVRVRQESGTAVLELARDDGLADGCVRIAAAHPATAALGAMFGEIRVEPA